MSYLCILCMNPLSFLDLQISYPILSPIVCIVSSFEQNPLILLSSNLSFFPSGSCFLSFMEGVPFPAQVSEILSYFLLWTLEFFFSYWGLLSFRVYLLIWHQAGILLYVLLRVSWLNLPLLHWRVTPPTTYLLMVWLWVSSSVPGRVGLPLRQTVLLLCFFSFSRALQPTAPHSSFLRLTLSCLSI